MEVSKKTDERLNKVKTQMFIWLCLVNLILILTAVLDLRKVILLVCISAIAYGLIKQLIDYYIQGLISDIQMIFWCVFGCMIIAGIFDVITYTNLF